MDPTAIFHLGILALATAAISLTLTKAQIFAPLRGWVASRSKWFGELASCFYCMSHWIAIAFVVIYRPILVSRWFLLDLLVSVFAIVAVSAVISSLVLRLTSAHKEEQSQESEQIRLLRSALEAAKAKILEQKQVIDRLQT